AVVIRAGKIRGAVERAHGNMRGGLLFGHHRLRFDGRLRNRIDGLDGITHIRTSNYCFLRIRMKELRPNQANESVKPAARIPLPGPAPSPAWYFPYSRRPSTAPLAAIASKGNPATSTQRWRPTFPTEL